MERHSSKAMFISEIPVRYNPSTVDGEKRIQWLSNLTSRTTARDVVKAILPTNDSTNYVLYIYTDRNKQILKDSTRIYRVVARMNQQKCSERLLFEIRPRKMKKRVRFADDIVVQNITRERCVSTERTTKDMIETISTPFTKRSKENFQIQENYVKSSFPSKRSSLKKISGNLPHSSSESGISSNSSSEDLILLPTKPILETLV